MAEGRRSIPPCVSQVACYESLQALYAAASAPGGGEPSMVAHGAIGIVAGALAGSPPPPPLVLIGHAASLSPY